MIPGPRSPPKSPMPVAIADRNTASLALVSQEVNVLAVLSVFHARWKKTVDTQVREREGLRRTYGIVMVYPCIHSESDERRIEYAAHGMS